MHARQPRHQVDKARHNELTTRFMAAAGSGDFDQVVALLAPDAVLISDGGGKKSAALRPIHGPEKIARWLFGVLRSNPGFELRRATLNGESAFVAYFGDEPDTVAFLQTTGGLITELYLIRNPDKLTTVPARHDASLSICNSVAHGGAVKYVVVEPDEALDPGLRADLLDTWIAATDAGGAVGFVARHRWRRSPRPWTKRSAGSRPGMDLLGVLHNGERYVGMGLLVDAAAPCRPTGGRCCGVMVHPNHQGTGAGRMLMEGLRGSAVDLGLEQLATHDP